MVQLTQLCDKNFGPDCPDFMELDGGFGKDVVDTFVALHSYFWRHADLATNKAEPFRVRKKAYVDLKESVKDEFSKLGYSDEWNACVESFQKRYPYGQGKISSSTDVTDLPLIP